MANYCGYSMKVKGEKDNVILWLHKMTGKSEDDRLGGFYTTDVYEEEDDCIYICGDCKWSVESCFQGDADLIAELSKELDIEVEIWSEEPGWEFQEHFLYKKGICYANDCIEWHMYYWDNIDYPTFKEYADEEWNGECPVDEDDFDEDGYAYSGGFEDYEEWHI